MSTAPPVADNGAARVHRSQSARHTSNPHSHAYRPSADQATNASHVARRDFEQNNVAQIPRRSVSRDGAANPQYPTRTDSTRAAQPSRERRYASIDASTARPPPTNGVAAEYSSSRSHPSASSHPSTSQRKRTYVTCSTGTWVLGKTIGQGSMGKVKLAKNQETGEQVAVKIVPRQSTDEHRTPAERERADHSKEVRTAREAAIVSLTNHPYICGMKDVYRTNYHWYMLFEYVNGGQMLDYIISHGRLKEKGARKFARQIASALDYCHRNSIVHRDLKIENILISKTGDIKIIDFGLSNLFSPYDHLKTFCGSLYFAAPELLQAKQYTGPEVDIWSFGVVLYVLVCGKVPFDDQSMPQLHAKIKKGNAEYPPWLSNECKNLIGRMLVTDPRQRATLAEIMNHPWMIKGFNGPPENYLPHREPITLPLDPVIVQKMTGFDFGPADYIQAQITKVVESDRYQRAVRQAAQKHMNPPEADKGRSMFGFYKRRSSTTSKDNLNSSTDILPIGEDAINAFAPMLSVYYLVKEKMARERQQSTPGATSMPTSPGEKPLKMPDLPPPPAAVTNSSAYEMQGETTGGRSRPRARTRGEDEIAPNAANASATEKPKPTHQEPQLSPTPAQAQAEQQHQKKESTAGAILRRISTRRRRPDFSDKSTTPQVAITSPSDTGPVGPRKSFQGRFPGRADPTSSASLHATGSQKHQPPELLTPPGTETSSFPRRFMSLRRAASVDRRRLRRGGSEAYDPPPTSGSDGSTHQIKPQQTAPAEQADIDRNKNFGTRTKSLGHARRESIQARRALRETNKDQGVVKEETDQEVARAKHEPTTDNEGGEDALKPVYLKGLFSVSTTSSKPLTFIRSDIIRVLKDLGVDFTEISGGFRCHHAPSLKDVGQGPLSPNLLPDSAQGRSHRRKVSFQGLGEKESESQSASKLSNATPKTSNRAVRGLDGSPAISDTDSESNVDDKKRPNPRSSTSAAKDAGTTSTHVRDEMSRNMIVDFEIFIVKVPLLRLHGIQFKKVDGNIMQYKTLAQEILTKLRL